MNATTRRGFLGQMGQAAAAGALAMGVSKLTMGASPRVILPTTRNLMLMGPLEVFLLDPDASSLQPDYTATVSVPGVGRVLPVLADFLGLNQNYGDSPGYQEAAQCTNQFKAFEEAARRQDLTRFTDVQRVAGNTDVAYIFAADQEPRAGSTQHGGRPSVPFVAPEAIPLIAAGKVASDRYNYNTAKRAEAFVLTDLKRASEGLIAATPAIQWAYKPSGAPMGTVRVVDIASGEVGDLYLE